MRAESQSRPDVALRAARERVAPTALGGIAAVVAILVLPRTTEGPDYFGVAAQVLPVLLLALAIEARLFGGRARRNPGDEKADPRYFTAGTLELGRQLLNFVTVALLLVAEVDALRRLANADEGEHAVWLENAALVSGFTTVAVLALFGTGAPRLVAILDATPHPDSRNNLIVAVELSNEYGDKDATPVMNLLVPGGISIYRCDANGNIDQKRSREMQTLHASEPIGGVSDWNYPWERVLVSAGDATVGHYLLEGLLPGGTYLLVLRCDHDHLPRGRVEVQLKVATAVEE